MIKEIFLFFVFSSVLFFNTSVFAMTCEQYLEAEPYELSYLKEIETKKKFIRWEFNGKENMPIYETLQVAT